MTVIVDPTLLGEMQLSFYLRGDERVFVMKEKGELLESCWSNDTTSSPQYDSFIGMREGIRELLKML